MGRAAPVEQARPAQPPSKAARLLQQAISADRAGQYDLAIDYLYELMIEHPRTTELREGRLRLARLLVLADAIPAAVLQCQQLRFNETASEGDKLGALNLATTVARRLRMNAKAPEGGLATGVIVNVRRLKENEPAIAAVSYYSTMRPFAPAGLSKSGENVWIDGNGPHIGVVDQASGRAFLVQESTATPVAGATQAMSAAFLADGSLIVADRSGLVKSDGTKVDVAGGRLPVQGVVRSMAANSRGDLFFIGEAQSIVRCQGAACGPWGPPGRYKTIRVGASDLVYVQDEGQSSVRVLDIEGRVVASVGPTVGTVRIGRLADFAIDSAHGVYLLDSGERRVQVAALNRTPAGFAVKDIATIPLPRDGDQAVRDATAIGITADGAMLLAARQGFLRFQ